MPINLFQSCFQDVMDKKVQTANPVIFKSSFQPSQVIPNFDQSARRRSSVFQKVDVTALNNDYPKYEKTSDQNEQIKKILKTFYLTANLEDHELEKITGAMKAESFKNEENIIKYGDSGRIFYILAKGTVNVHIYEEGANPDDPQLEEKRKILKPMQEGVYFGELALLYNDKRSASIYASSDVETFTLDGNLFKMIIVKASMNKRSI